MTAKKTVLFIDGENFLFSIARFLKADKKIQHKSDIRNFSIGSIIKSALNDYSIGATKFYAAKIHVYTEHPELLDKSRLIAESQRRLKRALINQDVEFIVSGHVRLQELVRDKNGKITRGIFKEKGTDVQIAIDMLSMACDGLLDTVLLLSSDSDMQPAVKELKKRGAGVVYIGFEDMVNAGLSITCDTTILLRKKEIIAAWDQATPKKLAL